LEKIKKIERKICILMGFWNGIRHKLKLITKFMIAIQKQNNRLWLVIFGCTSLREIVTVN
jgi:hypothetical protein